MSEPVSSQQQLAGKLAALATSPEVMTFRRGIEREGLRVDAQGNLARTPHPPGLGSKLTHPSITTDFSESQLEMITPVDASVDHTLEKLGEIHQIAHHNLGDEILWAASMPCVLQGDDSIPLAQYGTSNLGRLKTTYRNGLGHRYGRAMQTICAVHYNFSFNHLFWQALADFEGGDAGDNPVFRSRRYFDLMRNFRRLSWLPLYLFGASPAVCNSFVRGREHNLERFDEGSLYQPGATSLRSGRLGYQSDTQGDLIRVCYNSLDNYVRTLAEAICTPLPEYQALGLVKGDEYIQVNDSILQSEAEFYTTIRAKCVPPKGSNFLRILRDRGVEYLEVRLLDLNPYLPLGVDANEINFLDMLLLYCLLEESPALDDAECDAATANAQQVVYGGRDPATQLDDRGTARGVREWGLDVMANLEIIATTLDKVHATQDYSKALQDQRDKLADSEATPSARVLADMKAESVPFFRFAMNKALAHQAWFREQPLARETIEEYDEIAQQSLREQAQIETGDTEPFDAYLARINAEYHDLL